LLDLASVAIPAGTVRGLPFGIMLTGPAGSDRRLAEIAGRHDQAPVDLLVVGAHLSGQPLNHEVRTAGGTLVGPAATAKRYRLLALDTTPPKPGLVRQAEGGESIAGEVGRLPAVGFARFMDGLAAPMVTGRVYLDDGRDVLGFLCEPAAARRLRTRDRGGLPAPGRPGTGRGRPRPRRRRQPDHRGWLGELGLQVGGGRVEGGDDVGDEVVCHAGRRA
jgi:allophanate hydrolase